MKDPLVNKILHYFLTEKNHRGRCGQYAGRVIAVTRLKSGVVKSITVRRPTYDGKGFKWNGAKRKLKPDDWNRPGYGILFRKKIVPVAEFKVKR